MMVSKLNDILPLSRSEKERIEYQRYKNLGICPKCKKNKPDPGKVSCQTCLEKARNTNSEKSL